MKQADVVIVGAGSAGCVLAARLSEDPERSVLLLEAGDNYATTLGFPPEVLQANSMASNVPGHPNNWSLIGALTPDLSYSVPRGKGLGGSSALNGTYFMRGTREDFDVWAERGNDEWAYDKVLPYFIRAEDDRDLGGDLHGKDGPMPIHRQDGAEYNEVSRAFVQSCRDAGFAEERDKNVPAEPGIGPIPLNNIDNVRLNTGITYILPNLGRPNLAVEGNVEVTKIRFAGNRAVGVEVVRDGTTETIEAGEVVLSAGAVKSPHLLMLSGIGPAAMLAEHDIPVLVDLPVGQSFEDHPDLMIPYQIDKRISRHEGMAVFQTALNFTATGSDIVGDMEIVAATVPLGEAMAGTSERVMLRGLSQALRRPGAAWSTLKGISKRRLAEQLRRSNDLVFFCGLQRARSRGQIALTSADPRAQPALNYHYLEDPFDQMRMREGIRLAAKLLDQAPFRALGAKRTAPSPEVIESDTRLDAWMSSNLATAIHMSASCRMGPESDETSVVDQHCRVRGAAGLRVVDSSIMPSLVRRGPAGTVVMVAERASAFFE